MGYDKGLKPNLMSVSRSEGYISDGLVLGFQPTINETRDRR